MIVLQRDADVCLLLPAGEYEYIEVVFNEERLIVDVDFQAQLEIT
jgi:hypothetical protein